MSPRYEGKPTSPTRKPVRLRTRAALNSGQDNLTDNRPAAAHRPSNHARAANITDKTVRRPDNRTATPTGFHTTIVMPNRHISPDLSTVNPREHRLALIQSPHKRSR